MNNSRGGGGGMRPNALLSLLSEEHISRVLTLVLGARVRVTNGIKLRQLIMESLVENLKTGLSVNDSDSSSENSLNRQVFTPLFPYFSPPFFVIVNTLQKLLFFRKKIICLTVLC